ncbi:hypothetical protein E2C01_002819 [Portunus trituberculatus]|uniref:Uncharacterized protein n=1 Tax=Portunus trituberculatus TaxID=210409 RepID=A0A5B7CM93_PORTR|nr:hypothetical protein [Portunus trituberculatus]
MEQQYFDRHAVLGVVVVRRAQVNPVVSLGHFQRLGPHASILVESVQQVVAATASIQAFSLVLQSQHGHPCIQLRFLHGVSQCSSSSGMSHVAQTQGRHIKPLGLDTHLGHVLPHSLTGCAIMRVEEVEERNLDPQKAGEGRAEGEGVLHNVAMEVERLVTKRHNNISLSPAVDSLLFGTDTFCRIGWCSAIDIVILGSSGCKVEQQVVEGVVNTAHLDLCPQLQVQIEDEKQT